VEGLTIQILKFDIRAYPKFVAAAYLFYQYTFMKNAKKQRGDAIAYPQSYPIPNSCISGVILIISLTAGKH